MEFTSLLPHKVNVSPLNEIELKVSFAEIRLPLLYENSGVDLFCGKYLGERAKKLPNFGKIGSDLTKLDIWQN